MTEPALAEFSVTFPAEGDRAARQALDRLLTGDSKTVRDRAMLLISELLGDVSDRAGIRVKLVADDASLRIEVRSDDRGVIVEGLRSQKGSSPPGWTPHLLGRMSDRWGLVSSEEGAWIWVELDLAERHR